MRLSKLVIPYTIFSLSVVALADPVKTDTGITIGQLMQWVHSAQLWRDKCSDLFPVNAAKYEGLFNESVLKKYETLFGSARSFRDPSLSTDQLLRSIGQTKEQAQEWCEVKFPSAIQSMDEQLALKFEENEALFHEEFKKYEELTKHTK